MEYGPKTQKMINRLGTIMICYAIASILILILGGWELLDIICFIANALTFVLFQFLNVNKTIISIMCIIIGAVTTLFLSGLPIIIGLIMAIYGIILIFKLKKND